MKNRKKAVVITGPTGVGKSDLALKLAEEVNGEIVNADIGQFYTPLTIGTAKPDYKSTPLKHHLFDLIDTPTHFTVVDFRFHVATLVQDLYNHGITPIIVGGSSFYLKALFFPPHHKVKVPKKTVF